MAGTSYFNKGSNSSNGFSPFYQIKPLLLLTKTNSEYFITTSQVVKQGLDVWRSGAANKNFLLTSSSSLVLRTINSDGTTTTVTTTNSSSYTGGSGEYSTFHLNTADQCLYCLIVNSPTYALIKIGDSSGIATAIGSSFTPSNPSNWPQQYNQDSATMFVNSLGNLEITFRGFKHQLNKTTGAIISQDTPVSVGGGLSCIGCDYITSDGVVAASSFSQAGFTNPNLIVLPRIVNSSTGIVESLGFEIPHIFNGRLLAGTGTARNMVRVDSNKIYFGAMLTSPANPLGYYATADYDQFLRSVVDWYLGV